MEIPPQPPEQGPGPQQGPPPQQVPPQQAAPPPQQYAAYYRPTAQPHGSAAKLQALADGYFGLNIAFIINVGLAIGVWILQVAIIGAVGPGTGAAFAVTGASILGLGVAVGLVTYPHNSKIAFGKDWPSGNAALASVLMALNSILCCGLIGYVVMQQIAAAEMKRYGVVTGFLGIRKQKVAQVVDDLKAREAHAPASPFQI